jgi:hypothetical protein
MAEGFDYSMDAIPTTYDGAVFRSRLEAHWAAFFDLVGWSYQYEPFDLQGWIPDFVLLGAQKVLVEVKPYFTEEIKQSVLSAYFRSFTPKGNPQFEVLFLSTGPEERNVEGVAGRVVLGELVEFYDAGPDGSADYQARVNCAEAVMGIWIGSESKATNAGRRMGFCHAIGSFHDRMTGCYDGGCYGEGTDGDLAPVGILQGWREAGNVVQWNPRNRSKRNGNMR